MQLSIQLKDQFIQTDWKQSTVAMWASCNPIPHVQGERKQESSLHNCGFKQQFADTARSLQSKSLVGKCMLSKPVCRLEQLQLPFESVKCKEHKEAIDTTQSHNPYHTSYLNSIKWNTFVRVNCKLAFCASHVAVKQRLSGLWESKAELLIHKAENSQHSHGHCHICIAAWFFLGKLRKMGLCRGRT